MRIGLVGCVKSKHDQPSPARDLYISTLFVGRRRHVERTCDDWFVLSAKHGLVRPETVIEPYDVALTTLSSRERREWSRTVLAQLGSQVGDLASHEFEIHAGSSYRDFGLIEGLVTSGATVEVPAAGLAQGEQLAFYATGARPSPTDPRTTPLSPAAPVRQVRPTGSGGKYGPLGRHLAASDDGAVSLGFREIEEILGAPLPASARTYREWWANTERNPQARPWLAAGYRLDSVDFMASRAVFRRVRHSAPSSAPSKRLELGDITELEAFTFRWPAAEEHFERGWDLVARAPEGTHRVRHAIGSRHVFGRDRAHSVTWVDGAPQVEASAADDYAETRDLVGLIKRDDGRDARSETDLPSGYEGLPVVTHRDAVHGPWARRSLAVRLREDDLEGWVTHALTQARLRRARSTAKKGQPATQEQPPRPTEAPAPDGTADAVAAALLAHNRTLAEGGPANFSDQPEADEFLRSDPFAFLVAVVFDQGIVAERAWSAPWLLKQRLGHLDPARMVADPDAVRAAIAQRPSLHRYVENVPRWVVAAADRVLHDYWGDAESIWNDEPTATELRRRLEEFDGIGQKKAAMAVEILERDRGVVVRDLAGSDVAFDVHVRRVFLRTGLADADDLRHVVEQARLAHPDRPGELDLPAWDIGRTWCRPQDPLCDECPLGSVCPRLLSRAAGVR